MCNEQKLIMEYLHTSLYDFQIRVAFIIIFMSGATSNKQQQRRPTICVIVFFVLRLEMKREYLLCTAKFHGKTKMTTPSEWGFRLALLLIRPDQRPPKCTANHDYMVLIFVITWPINIEISGIARGGRTQSNTSVTLFRPHQMRLFFSFLFTHSFSVLCVRYGARGQKKKANRVICWWNSTADLVFFFISRFEC